MVVLVTNVLKYIVEDQVQEMEHLLLLLNAMLLLHTEGLIQQIILI